MELGSAKIENSVLTIRGVNRRIAVYDLVAEVPKPLLQVHLCYHLLRPSLSAWGADWLDASDFPDVIFVQHPDPQAPARPLPFPIFKYKMRARVRFT